MTVSDGGVGAAVLVAGSGHLADRLEELLRSTRPVVGRVDVIHPGPLAPFEDALERANIRTAAALYVVDDRDAANVQFTLAALKVRPELPITMALSNEGLVPHLQELHPNLAVINPWEIVTPDIVRALKAPASATATSVAALPPDRIRRHPWMRGSLALLALGAVCDAARRGDGVFPLQRAAGLDHRRVFRRDHGNDDGVRRHQPAHLQRRRENPRYRNDALGDGVRLGVFLAALRSDCRLSSIRRRQAPSSGPSGAAVSRSRSRLSWRSHSFESSCHKRCRLRHRRTRLTPLA